MSVILTVGMTYALRKVSVSNGNSKLHKDTTLAVSACMNDYSDELQPTALNSTDPYNYSRECISNRVKIPEIERSANLNAKLCVRIVDCPGCR